jgi:nickel-dependent lactate racemase
MLRQRVVLAQRRIHAGAGFAFEWSTPEHSQPMPSAQSVPEWCELLPGVVLEKLGPAPLARRGDGVAQMRSALEGAQWVAAVRLASRDDQPVTFVVNDAHRVTATAEFLEAAFELLDAGGVAIRPRLLVAAGTHRADASERSAHERRILGRHRERFDGILWHDAYDSADHVDVGGHAAHRWMADGGLCVACGSMEPHYFAGVTGAHKTLTVGVLSAEAITANHAHAMEPSSRGLRLEGNPVHEGIIEVLAALEAAGTRLFALNQIIVDGGIAAVTAGSPLAALDEGLPIVRSAFAHVLSGPVDLIVARVRPPLDRDVYQADKGIKNTEVGVRDGGVLVVEAECPHGVGIDHFVETLRAAPTHREVLAAVAARGYRLGDHKAVRLRALTDTRGVRAALVSAHVEPALGDVLGMAIFASRRAAADWVLRELAGTASTGIEVVDAGNVTLEVA